MKPATAAAILCASCASGPYTLWQGKSPDRNHAFTVIEDGNRQSVSVDGRKLGDHDAIALASLTFSADGQRIAYAARDGSRWHVVGDPCLKSTWTGIGQIVFAPSGERILYSAERDHVWHAVIGDHAGPPFKSLLSGTLTFSRDGSHFAYVAEDTGGVHGVVDHTPGPAFEGIAQLGFGPDSREVVYRARRGSVAYVVRGTEPGPPYDEVDRLVVSSTGNVAFFARKGRAWSVVTDRALHGPYDRPGELVFSNDGTALAFSAEVGGRQRIYRDGVEVEAPIPFTSARSLRFSGVDLAYVARDPQGKTFVIGPRSVSRGYDEIGDLVASVHGGHWAFSARSGSSWTVVIDGRPGQAETWVSQPVLSRGGTRSAYLVRRGPRIAVIVDGQSHPFDVVIDDTIVFSDDAKHWGCIAGDLEGKRLQFIVDGRRVRELDFRELAYRAAQMEFDQLLRQRDDPVLRHWVAAEIARLGGRARAPNWIAARCSAGSPAPVAAAVR
jgi:hypothetical protein